jgi:hypothetical protein
LSPTGYYKPLLPPDKLRNEWIMSGSKGSLKFNWKSYQLIFNHQDLSLLPLAVSYPDVILSFLIENNELTKI